MRAARKTFAMVAAALFLFGCVPVYDGPYGGYYPYGYAYGGYGGYPYTGFYGGTVFADPYYDAFFASGIGYFGLFGRGYGLARGRSFYRGFGYGRAYAGGGGFGGGRDGGFRGGGWGGGHAGGGHGGGGGHR